MRKIQYLLFTVLLFASCTEDVKFNNPAFQGLKDNVFWRAQSYTSYAAEDGNFFIEGSLGYEKVTFKISNPSQKTYILGVDNITTASYSNTLPGQLVDFTTGANKGNGQIIITEFNSQTNTISGTYKFKAMNVDEKNTEKPEINFTEGVFYKIPFSITPSH